MGVGFEDVDLLKQQPKVPNLEIFIPKNLLGPFPSLARDPLGLDLATLFLVKIPDSFDIFVADQAERDIVDPRPQPLVMPLAEHGQLVDQTIAEEPSVVSAGKGIAVDVQQIARPEGVEHVDGLDGAKELALRVAVARVALADEREFHVKVVRELLHGGLLFVPHGVRAAGVVELQDLGRVGGLDLGHESLSMLAPPSAVAGEAAGGTPAPVHCGSLVLPRHISVLVILDAAHEVPWRRIQNVLEAGDF